MRISVLLILVACGKSEPGESSHDRRPADPTTPAATTPPQAGTYATFEKCADDFSDTNRVSMFLSTDGKGKARCGSFHGARAKVTAHATPGGKLTLGDGKPVDIPDSGEVDVSVDLGAPILALKVDDFVVADLGAKLPPLDVPYAFDAGGKHLAGKLTFAQESFEGGKLFSGWLADIVDGKVDRPAFDAPKPGARKTIVLLGSLHRLYSTDRRGTVKEIAAVATIVEKSRTESGTCEFETGGTKTVAKRIAVDTEVSVTALADGKVIATKPFPAPAGCPMFAMLDPNKPETAVQVEDTAILKYLETLAKP